ncbi:MAG: hypothetical protein R3C53_01890 [Pirellulaceae bacterium]
MNGSVADHEASLQIAQLLSQASQNAAAADTDADGFITAMEYADYRSKH